MQSFTRFVCGGGILSLAIVLAIAAATTSRAFADSGGAGGERTGAAPALREAAGEGLLVGAAVSAGDLEDPAVAALVAREFGCLTAENEFKPASLQRERGRFTFERADRIADFAEKHRMKLIGHTLVWHQQSPAWMLADADGRPLGRAAALENLKNHIEAVVGHFQGRVLGWDVVNEAISDEGDAYLRETPARRAIGDDYVAKAFEFARAADPDVELYYNDYNIDQPGKREKAVRLIRELQAAGVRVDGVGIQGHWLLESPDVRLIDEAITTFAGLGVKVMVTELDVDVLPRRRAGADVSAVETRGLDPYRQGLPEDVQRRLAERYGELFAVFAKHRGATLTRVTFWGVHDARSWLNNWPVRGRTNHPLLWDRELRPKPALAAVERALRGSASDPP